MKKIIVLFISIFISFSITNTTNAWNIERKLYKQVIITKFKIKNDYRNGELYNKKIAEIFVKYRYNKDKITLNKLEVLLKNKIISLKSKSILSRAERIKLNLYYNLYFRSKLLLEYNLK